MKKDKPIIALLRERVPREQKTAVGILHRSGPPPRIKGGDPARIATKIVKDVQRRGTTALLGYTRRFDSKKITASKMLVKKGEYAQAMKEVDADVMAAMRHAIANIKSFHRRQVRNSWLERGTEGDFRGMEYRPLEKVGIYAPAFQAPLPSSLIMCAVPAKIVGVREVVVVTPPAANGSVNPYMLAAARECGVDKVFKCGGAQAIAALAYGVPPLPKVDKIVGPGSAVTNEAKRLVFGAVGIDGFNSSSEVMILADASASPSAIAADLLGQAEHDPAAVPVLVTTVEILALAVVKELGIQLRQLPRRDIAAKSLALGMIYVVGNMDMAMECANLFAPEHLALCLADPRPWLGKARNAGAVFLGHWTPEVLGDYYAGPNHCLPTGGTARFASALGCDDFVKSLSILGYTQGALHRVAADVTALARLEGLEGHARAVEKRLKR